MLTLILAALQAAAATAPPAPLSPAQIAAAAPAAAWVDIAADDLLVMELAPTPAGEARRVVIQLVPAPFATSWVANIRTLARANWWDGTSVNRVQDNYVAQWGDATEAKPLPAGLLVTTERDYELRTTPPAIDADASEPAIVTGMPADAYAERGGFHHGFAIAGEREEDGRLWPVHCYGSIGVGRNLSPDAGTGAELYAVIGHAPRHLDRNIAVVGRVIEGIEHLSSLPRGTGALGFYERPEQRVAILSIRLASDLPAAQRPRFQYLSERGDTFARYVAARQNRELPFFIRPAGGADICNVPVPTRQGSDRPTVAPPPSP